MALLIDIGVPDWLTDEQLIEQLAPYLSGADIRKGNAPGNPADIKMIATSRSPQAGFSAYPNVQLVQKLGAGVDTIARATDLASHVRVSRLKPDNPAREIAEYCLAYVLAGQRHLKKYWLDQVTAQWRPVPPKITAEIKVGVLGLGHIGSRIAKLLQAVDIDVIGWSRTQKHLEGIDCRFGNNALASVLHESDYVVSILPSTAQTHGLFNKTVFAQMKQDSTFINVGRGDLVVDDDLLFALDHGPLQHAVLDVLNTEPLPEDHVFWDHAKISITPHVSGWHLGDGILDVAENYKRLLKGEPLLNEIDRVQGY